jgi:iron complex outermembrane receptor protein
LKGAVVAGKEFENGLDLMISGLWSDIKGRDAYYQEFDTPLTNNGIAHGLDWEKSYGFITAVNYKGFTLLGNITSRRKGIPTASFSMTFNDKRATTLDERKYVELKFTHEFGGNKGIIVRTYFDHYGYIGTSPYDVLSFDASDGNWWGGECQFRWDIASSHRITVGVEHRDNYRADYRLWDENTFYFNGNFPNHMFSVFLQDEYQLTERLLVTLGVRRDRYSTVGSSTTPRGAVVFNPFKSATFKLLYGEAFRAPNVSEVNYQDLTSGYKDNPQLRPEKIRTIETIWEQRFNTEMFGSVSFYHSDMMDLIDPTVDATDSLIQNRNVSRIKARGFEVEFDVRSNVGLSGYTRYTYQYASDVNRNTKLTNSPSHLLRVGLTHPVLDGMRAAIELQFESQRITVYGTTTSPYLLTNLSILGGPMLGQMGCSLLIRNVFNTTYKTPGGFEHRQPAIGQDGRNFTLRLEYKF